MAFAKKPIPVEELSHMLFVTPSNAGKLIDRSKPYIYKKISENRLKAEAGLVEVEHLKDQARNGFPEISQSA